MSEVRTLTLSAIRARHPARPEQNPDQDLRAAVGFIANANGAARPVRPPPTALTLALRSRKIVGVTRRIRVLAGDGLDGKQATEIGEGHLHQTEKEAFAGATVLISPIRTPASATVGVPREDVKDPCALPGCPGGHAASA